MSAETLLVILLIGAIARWLAGQIIRGTGFGLVADIALGIVGAFIGTWLLPQLGIRRRRSIIPRGADRFELTPMRSARRVVEISKASAIGALFHSVPSG